MTNDTERTRVGQCDITDCHRDAVLELSYTNPDESRTLALCLPCRRAVGIGQGIPSGNWSESWTDEDSLNSYRRWRPLPSEQDGVEGES
jgi:hypothetical protein